MITVQQPWAWALIHGDPQIPNGVKDVENRSKETAFRGRLLIHAGKKTDSEGFKKLDDLGIARPLDLERGVIIGSVQLVDCVQNHDSPWAFAFPEWNWVVEDPVPAARLIEVRGNLGLLDPPADWRRAFRESDPPTGLALSRIRDAMPARPPVPPQGQMSLIEAFLRRA